jgi:DNA-binding transcriptional LysR family regulator
MPPPKVIAPKHSSDTRNPERPNSLYRMEPSRRPEVKEVAKFWIISTIQVQGYYYKLIGVLTFRHGVVMRQMQNLWYFTQVAKARSFTAAADHLALSTAALSKSIAALERRLSVKLFIRSSRALHLTEEGSKLLDSIAEPFHEIEESSQGVWRGSAAPTGVVQLSTVTSYGKHCVLPLLPKFFRMYPQIDLVMSFHDGRRGLTRQASDVRINWGERFEKGKVSQVLCTMPLIAVASPAYVARHGKPRVPEELLNHQCINVLLADGTRPHWTFAPMQGGRRERVTAQVPAKGRLVVTDELDGVVDAAKAGLGITISSAENILADLREGRLVQILEDYRVLGQGTLRNEIIVQYGPRRRMAPRVKAFVDFLLAELKGRDPLDIAGRNPQIG